MWLGMLEDMKEHRTRTLLTEHCSLLLRGCEGPDGSNLIPDMFMFGQFEQIGATFKRQLQFCRMVLCLLQPKTFGWDSDAVMFFVKYPGKAAFESSIKRCLTRQAAADGKDKDQTQYVQALVADVKRTAASMVLAKSDFQAVTKVAESAESAIPALVSASETLATVKQKLRLGLFEEVNEQLGTSFVRHALHILSQGDASTDSESVSNLVAALKARPQQKACCEALCKLLAWVSKHNEGLLKKDLTRILEAYNASAERDANRLAPTPIDAGKLRNLLTKGKSCKLLKDDPALARTCMFAIAYMLKEGFHQAGFVVGVVFSL